ncbi:MAG: hypothetical protein ACR2MT_08030, partial [Aurantibacter sp.]
MCKKVQLLVRPVLILFIIGLSLSYSCSNSPDVVEGQSPNQEQQQDPEPQDPNLAQEVVYELIPADHQNYVYHGRMDFTDPEQARIFWPGSGVTAYFSGTSVKVYLNDTENS